MFVRFLETGESIFSTKLKYMFFPQIVGPFTCVVNVQTKTFTCVNGVIPLQVENEQKNNTLGGTPHPPNYPCNIYIHGSFGFIWDTLSWFVALRIEMFMSVFKSIQIERGEVASENLTYMEFDAWQMGNKHMVST